MTATMKTPSQYAGITVSLLKNDVEQIPTDRLTELIHRGLFEMDFRIMKSKGDLGHDPAEVEPLFRLLDRLRNQIQIFGDLRGHRTHTAKIPLSWISRAYLRRIAEATGEKPLLILRNALHQEKHTDGTFRASFKQEDPEPPSVEDGKILPFFSGWIV